MSITRRQFMLGTAGASAGLILPSYYNRALEFLDRTGKPLLEAVERPRLELIATITGATELPYQLWLGDPYDRPPPLTLRQFSDRYSIDLYDWLYLEEGDEPEWDKEVDWNDEGFYDTWLYTEPPEKPTYELLQGIDLGPELTGAVAVGEIHLEHGHNPFSYWDVSAADKMSLSLLQQRLNDLRSGIYISIQ